VQNGARGTLHLACEGVASWYDLAVAIVGEGARRGLNPSLGVRPVSSAEMPRPARRPTYAVLGLERSRKLGINMLHWRDALTAYLDAEVEKRDA
jgi:dTDP-4-dehydrorhamnose reductase